MDVKMLIERRTDPAVGVAAGLAAAGVLLSADVHLDLWQQGFRLDPVFGPLFLATAIGGFAIGVACVSWPCPSTLLAALGFGVMTLGALLMSAAVGLFGLHETLSGIPQRLSLGSEALAGVAAGVALILMRRRPTPATATVAGAH
jgi:hypothetical protein